MTSEASGSNAGHRWRFYRTGGLDLVRLSTADDLRNLAQLDQKLWTALACPTKGLEFDEKTMVLIDRDGDGRVRAPEIIAAVQWVCDALADPAAIIAGGDSVPLNTIKDPALLASAKEILSSLGKAEAAAISLGDVTDTAKIFAQTKFNGDGVVPPAAAGDEATAQVLHDIIATQGGVADRSGADGVNAAKLDAFLADLAAFDGWSKQAETDAKSVLPLGENTAAALAALVAVRTKIDDYFARCRLAAFDARATAALNRQESEYLTLAAQDLTITADEIAAFPLARIEPSRPLPLAEGINPAWSAKVEAFREFVADPLLGGKRNTLTEADWSSLKARFVPYEAWSNAKAGATVEALGIARVRELLAADPKDAVTALIARDQALEPQFDAIANVERLVRFQRDLYRLLMNFVAFTDLYDPERPAIFQAGTLYLDNRSCELCIRVDGPNALAAMSKAYIAYCALTRPGSAPMTIAACFTQGDSDYLFVGRHGIFYDRQGRDWDAVITNVVDQPISIRQAFWLPYKKFLRMIEEQAAKRAAAAEAASEKKLATAASSTVNADKSAPAAAPKKVDVGTVAAIGVVITGAVSALTLILGYVFDLKAWQYPLVLLGLMLVISGPSMIIAALKLRQRTLGPILDGNGWAVNGRVKINVPFGTALTDIGRVAPQDRLPGDPYGEKRQPWGLYLFLLFLLAAGAVWVRWDHNQKGHYFWQPAPEPPATPAEPEAPAAPAPAG